MHRGIPTAQSAAGKSRNQTGLALLTSAPLTSTNSAALTSTALISTDPVRLLISAALTTALTSTALTSVTLTSAALALAALTRLTSSELVTKFELTSLLFDLSLVPFRTTFKNVYHEFDTYSYRCFSPHGVHGQAREQGFSEFFAP